MLLNIYVLKYATDVLLIAPAIMGSIFGLARIWDALTDPVVGYLSDRTRSRLGRRRIWLALGVGPAVLFYIMLYASPVGMATAPATLWMAIAVFGFYTAMTAISVPHYSLGAEATRDSYTRNKLFGMRHAMIGVGSMIALATLAWLTSIDQTDTEQLREASIRSAVVASILCVAGVLATALRFRESQAPTQRASQQSNPSEPIYSASVHILKNRNARLLLTVQFIESIGAGALGAAALYVAQYVMGNIEIAPLAMVCYLLMTTFSIPLWVRLSKRIEKVSLWIITMMGSAVFYGGLFGLVFLPQGNVQTSALIVLCILSGAMSGCGHTLAPSVLSDIIDEDDLATGTRKEGAFFALFNLAAKSAQGVTVMITGFVLSAIGFVPNIDQPFSVQLALCGILGLLPLVCYAVGAAMFTRFELRAEQRSSILNQLAARDAVG